MAIYQIDIFKTKYFCFLDLSSTKKQRWMLAMSIKCVILSHITVQFGDAGALYIMNTSYVLSIRNCVNVLMCPIYWSDIVWNIIDLIELYLKIWRTLLLRTIFLKTITYCTVRWKKLLKIKFQNDLLMYTRLKNMPPRTSI